MLALVNKYAVAEGLSFPDEFEHRVDPDSSRAIYSILRDYKPTNGLEIGTWLGGSTVVLLKALIKNGKKYKFVASELNGYNQSKTTEHCRIHCGVEPKILGDITQNLGKVPDKLDFLMVDTDHDLNTTQWILDNIFPRLIDGALVIFHDWAVTDKNDKWEGKGPNGAGSWPETQLLIELHEAGRFPLEKVYWNYDPPVCYWETGIFTYKKP